MDVPVPRLPLAVDEGVYSLVLRIQRHTPIERRWNPYQPGKHADLLRLGLEVDLEIIDHPFAIHLESIVDSPVQTSDLRMA